MAKIIAVANQKGGVGKTTTAVNLTAALKKRGKSVLLADCDPQGNATSGMGAQKSQSPNMYDLLVRGADCGSCIQKTEFGDVIGSNKELSGAAVELVNMENREYVLKSALAGIADSYDYIIIDCPPSLELLTINALAAAEGLIIPVQCEYYALEGIADLVTTIELCRQRINPKLRIMGIVLTMYDSRTNFSDQVADEISKYFNTLVFNTKIPRNVRIAESPSHGKPVIEYDRFSKGSRAYLKLAGELISREER